MIVNDSNVTTNNSPVIPAQPEFPKGRVKAQSVKLPPSSSTETTDASRHTRETGDQVNGFMLCALVSQSAKRLKVRAERVGVSLPMSIITRSVLNAYLIAAKDHQGPFESAKPDLEMIRNLNEQVLQEMLARNSREKINSRALSAGEAVRR